MVSWVDRAYLPVPPQISKSLRLVSDHPLGKKTTYLIGIDWVSLYHPIFEDQKQRLSALYIFSIISSKPEASAIALVYIIFLQENPIFNGKRMLKTLVFCRFSQQNQPNESACWDDSHYKPSGSVSPRHVSKGRDSKSPLLRNSWPRPSLAKDRATEEKSWRKSKWSPSHRKLKTWFLMLNLPPGND